MKDCIYVIGSILVLVALAVILLCPTPHVYKCTTDIECEMEERSLN